MPLVSFSSLPCGPGCCDMIWSRHVKKAKPIFVICLTLRSSTLYSPPLHQFCYPFPRHTQIPEFTHITSVSRSDFEFLIPFSANAASEFCPTSENVSERNTQDPSFLSKTPPGAWDLRLSLCNRKDWRPNPPPPVCIPPPLTVCETWATTPFHQTWLH